MGGARQHSRQAHSLLALGAAVSAVDPIQKVRNLNYGQWQGWPYTLYSNVLTLTSI
jgi:hypothetical protein